MQKYFDDISDANTGRTYEFSAAGHKMALAVVRFEYMQDFPAVEAGFFHAELPACTKKIVGFIGGLLIDGDGADGFSITDYDEDGPMLKYRIGGEYHSCQLPAATAAELYGDGNMPIYSVHWAESSPEENEKFFDKIAEDAAADEG